MTLYEQIGEEGGGGGSHVQVLGSLIPEGDKGAYPVQPDCL